jgi:hypothetical protein
MLFVRRPGESSSSFLAQLTGPTLGMRAEEIAVLLQSADSLDMVELMIELEAAWESHGKWHGG